MLSSSPYPSPDETAGPTPETENPSPSTVPSLPNSAESGNELEPPFNGGAGGGGSKGKTDEFVENPKTGGANRLGLLFGAITVLGFAFLSFKKRDLE
jgi:LPXTG-motif cell wall-anchored protein